MSLKGFYLLPHPPIALPEIGRGEERKISDTISGYHKVGKDIGEIAPDTIILITPHGVMFHDAISISYENIISGSFRNFGVPEVTMSLQIQKELSSKIYQLAYEENISSIMITESILKSYNSSMVLDHGAMVPLYFINKYYKDYKIVHITYAPFGDIELYKFGMVIQRAVNELNKNAVIIASGDLSHKLKDEGPYEYNPDGEKFDREFLDHLSKGDVKAVFSMDKEMICNAGECGRRSVAILLGALDGKKINGELLSYEGTFGVGYGTMKFNIIGDDKSNLIELESIRKANYEKKLNASNPYVRLARESLTYYIDNNREMTRLPDYITDEMKNTKRGVFVSLKKHGELRGCIGTILPTTDSIAEEIIHNAIEAGIHDPRFFAVEKDELFDIDFSVDVLTEPELATKEELDPKEYGIIVRTKGKSGLLLPDLEGVDSIDEQISIALRKAGIRPDESYELQRFRVLRYKED